MKKCTLAVLILVTLVFGCRERKDELVMSVNGHELTESVLKRKVDTMCRYHLIRHPKTQAAELSRVRRSLESNSTKQFLFTTVISDYAAENKIEPSSETIGKLRSISVRQCPKAKVKDWDGLLGELGPAASDFEENLRVEALQREIRDRLTVANPTNLPPDYGERKVAEIAAFNRMIDATNTATFVRATNVWQRLEKGADFGDMAAEYSELEAERADRGEWATLDWKQIQPDEELYAFAKGHAPGDFSPPIIADGGVMIARIDKKDEEECTISRIFFRMAIYVRARSAAELVEEAKAKHANALFMNKVGELVEAAKVVHGPLYDHFNGTEKKGRK